MSSDVRKIVYVTLIGFLLMLMFFFGLLFVIACNGTIACNQGQPITAVRTPIPTLIPVGMPFALESEGPVVVKCQVYAFELIDAWFAAGLPESDAFDVADINGQACVANFAADIQPLFNAPNLWFQGAQACTTCHYADLAAAQKNMDLSSYTGIMAGAERTAPDMIGKDILGGGNWKSSILYERLTAPADGPVVAMPLGRLAGTDLSQTIIFAGSAKETTTAP